MDYLSSRIKKLRNILDMTQTHLAEELGFSRTTIANYEQGLRTPSVEALSHIADYFDVSTDYLLGKTNLASTSRLWFQESKHIILSINISTGKIRDCSLGTRLIRLIR